MPRIDIYRGRDPRTLPAYSVAEAAEYLKIPRSTVRSWVQGRSGRRSARVIEPARDQPCLLSFENLVELHVLRGIRGHGVTIQAIRDALAYLANELGSERPLARESMQTDGVSLFVERLGVLVNVSRSGQLAMKQTLEAHLRRIERDPSGVPIKLYPFPASGGPERPFTIDPTVKFGRLCLTGTGIIVDELVDRYDAGESIASLARDFGRPERQIRAAISEAAKQAA
jgi:uncharacterized protein (DUF433 family)